MTLSPRALSIRTSLLLLSLACALPPLLLAAALLSHAYDTQKARAQTQMLETVRALRLAVDRELEGRLRAVEVLATSRVLQNGDFGEFARQAAEVVRLLPEGSNLILSDGTGQQFVNTLVPIGRALPRRQDVASVERVFATGKPLVSDLVIGAVSRAPYLGVSVPVLRDGRVAYDLTMGMPARAFVELLERQNVPEGWTVSISDGKGIHVARNRAAESFVGRPVTDTLRTLMAGRTEGTGEAVTLEGQPVLTAFSRSEMSGWAVAIGVPADQAVSSLPRYLTVAFGGGLLLMLFSALTARALAARIARPIRALADTAHVLRRGGAVGTARSGLAEADAVAEALVTAAAARSESETRWRELFEEMQEGFFVGEMTADPATGKPDFRVVEANPAFELLTGIRVADALGRSIRAVIPGIQDEIIDTYGRVAATGEPIQFELHVPALGGRWYEARARGAGPGRFAVLFLEVTARVRAGEELAERERQFRTITNLVPAVVWLAGPDGAVTHLNDRWQEYTGQPMEAGLGAGWMEAVHPDDHAAVTAAWTAARNDDEFYETEFRLRGRDGAYRWFLVRGDRLRDAAGRITGWFGTDTDIHDRKIAEATLRELNTTLEQRVQTALEEREQAREALRQAQKMEAVGQLTGGVAHDFNNLLQVVGGNLQLLLPDVAGNERAEQRVRNALSGVSRGSRLASSLLAFARRQPLQPRSVNLGRLVRSLDDMLRRALGEEVEIETVGAGGLWNTLVDPTQVENALLNLAINARDAMEGGGKLTIETGNAVLDELYAARHADVKAGQYVMLAVSDTGCGMPREVVERVFEPFFSTKPEGKGTGLGLSMVYGFVKQSGGHIAVYSEPGLGTTIRLYLPRTLQEEDVAVEADTGPVTGGTETVLVVEDDDAVRQTVVEMLTDLGYRVLKARDAQSALSILESGAAVDLLFTDVVMPGPLRSPELARKARERLPNLAVLFTSGYTENAIVHGGRLDPGVELLSKPYTREALARKIRHVLRNQRQRQVSPAERPAAVTGGRPEGRPEGLRILLVEDDVLIRMATAEMLAALGHTVHEAEDAPEALAILEETSIDLLMTDISLPGLPGDALARQAVERRPGLRVLFATGGERPRGMGGDAAWLQKPYNLEALRGALRTAGACVVG